MSKLTRLGFMKSSAAAAVGFTALGGIADQADAAEIGPIGSEPIVAYVKDPSSGHISVMSGKREVTVRDEKLAARIARAAR